MNADRRLVLQAAGLAAAGIATPAFAIGPPPVRVRGVAQAASAQALTVKARGGEVIEFAQPVDGKVAAQRVNTGRSGFMLPY